MCRQIQVTLLLGFFLSAAAAAQPTSEQIVDRAAQAYASMMEHVDNYLLTVETMGMEHQMYFERIEGAGPLDYSPSVRVIGHSGWVASENGVPGGASLPNTEVFERLRERASFAGEQTIDGQRVFALRVDDTAGLFDATELTADGDFDLDTMTLYVAADDYQMIGFDGQGTARQNGQTAEVTMKMRMSDFRTVGPIRHPFLTTMSIEGLAAALSDQERRQLEEAQRQMEQLPPAQRQMMERMMGDKLEQLKRMIEGESMVMEMRVVDLQANVPRPE
jgi:hypothetical protein